MTDITVNIAINVNEVPYRGIRFDQITHAIRVVELYKITDKGELATNVHMFRDIGPDENSILFRFKEHLGGEEYEELFVLELRDREKFNVKGSFCADDLVVHLRLILDETKPLVIYNDPVRLLDEEQHMYFVQSEHEFMCAMNHRMKQSYELLEPGKNHTDAPKAYPVVVIIYEEEGTYRYHRIDKQLAYVIDQAFSPI